MLKIFTGLLSFITTFAAHSSSLPTKDSIQIDNYSVIQKYLFIRFEPLANLMHIKTKTLQTMNAQNIKEQDLSPEVLKELEIPFEKVNDYLCCSLIIDRGDEFIRVSKRQLEKWGVSFSDALGKAKTNVNLAKLRKEQIAPKGWKISGDSTYAAHMCLLDKEFIYSLTKNPIVFIPDDECILIVDKEDKQSIEKVAKFALEIINATNKPLTGFVFNINNDGKLTPVNAEFGKTIQTMDELRLYAFCLEYRDLTTLGQVLVNALPVSQQPKDDIEIASIEPVVELYPKAKPYMTMATILANSSRPTLVPAADVIALFYANEASGQPEIETLFITLDDIKKSYPSLIKQVSQYPRTYLIDGAGLFTDLKKKQS